MSEKVRIAVIGCGQRGPGHAQSIAQSDTLELAAVCDIDEARASALGEKMGVPFLLDMKELYARDDIQAVSIAAHTPHHAAIALAAAQAGKHLLCEKPFAHSIDGAREVVQAAEDAGIVAMVGFQNRFWPFSLRMKEIAGQIGVVQVSITQHRSFFNPQYFYSDHYGGIMDGLSHDMDLALWWGGQTPRRIAGHNRRGVFKPDKNAIEFVNIVAECGDAANPVLVNMSGSMASIGMANIYQVVGSRGCASATSKQKLQVAFHEGFQEDKKPINPRQAEEEPDGRNQNVQMAMWNHFGQCVREGKTDVSPGASLRDGLIQVAVSQAGAESAASGQEVEVDI